MEKVMKSYINEGGGLKESVDGSLSFGISSA